MYHVYGHEHTNIGDAGDCTPHLQGYIYFATARTLSSMKKNVHPTAHFEPGKGNAKQNYDYCTKENDRIFVKGVMPVAGSRTDISDIKQMLDSGKTIGEVAQSASSYQALKYAETYSKYLPMPKGERDLTVYWHYGPAGSGKTYRAFADANPNDTWVSGRDLRWWQGYMGQKDVIIDDFRGSFCTFHELLRFLDKRPVQVEIKGGSVYLQATRIWITSPYRPQEVYAGRTNEEIAQLTRRIHFIRKFEPRVVSVPVEEVIASPDAPQPSTEEPVMY